MYRVILKKATKEEHVLQCFDNIKDAVDYASSYYQNIVKNLIPVGYMLSFTCVRVMIEDDIYYQCGAI